MKFKTLSKKIDEKAEWDVKLAVFRNTYWWSSGITNFMHIIDKMGE